MFDICDLKFEYCLYPCILYPCILFQLFSEPNRSPIVFLFNLLGGQSVIPDLHVVDQARKKFVRRNL